MAERRNQAHSRERELDNRLAFSPFFGSVVFPFPSPSSEGFFHVRPQFSLEKERKRELSGASVRNLSLEEARRDSRVLAVDLLSTSKSISDSLRTAGWRPLQVSSWRRRWRTDHKRELEERRCAHFSKGNSEIIGYEQTSSGIFCLLNLLSVR